MTDNIQILNDIEKAAELCEKKYSHDEIISVMQTENDFEKQICILKLDTVLSKEEAQLLVFQLTGHHGLIREAAAIKINELTQNEKLKHLFQTTYVTESLLKGINDINPNICRLMCALLPTLLENKKLKNIFMNGLYKRFYEVYEELEKLKRSTWYTKKLFNLYWCLEALSNLQPQINKDFEDIIEQASKIKDYTIREKAAMVLSKLPETSDKIDKIKKTLKDDENFYVRRYSQKF